MTFFFDNNIGRFIAKGLQGFGEDVIHLTDHFPPDASDEERLRFVGEQGLFLVTRDKGFAGALSNWPRSNGTRLAHSFL